jgi:hypothetical protein
VKLNACRFAVFIVVAFAILPLTYAQTGSSKSEARLSKEDRKRMERMMPRTLLPKIKNGFVFPHWIGKSDDFWYRRQTATGAIFLVV